MTNTSEPPIKLFQFPRMFEVPNLSPFCCKLETWLRIAQIPYERGDRIARLHEFGGNGAGCSDHAHHKQARDPSERGLP
jgi:hypothetical protein